MTLSIFQRTIVNASGDVQPGASVSVRDELTNNLVQIFSDRAGTVAKPNPFTADANGFATFFVSPGEYKVTANTLSGSVTWNYVAVDGTLRTDLATTGTGKGAEMVGYDPGLPDYTPGSVDDVLRGQKPMVGPITVVSGGTVSPQSNGLILRANQSEFGTAIVFWKHPSSTASTERLGQYTGHGTATGSGVNELACYTSNPDGSMENRYKVLAAIGVTPFILTGCTGISRSSGLPITIGGSFANGEGGPVQPESKVIIPNKLGVGASPQSNDPKLLVWQDDNATGGTAGASITQAGTGDAKLRYQITGVAQWQTGVDQSDSAKFKISSGSSLGSSDRLEINKDTGRTKVFGDVIWKLSPDPDGLSVGDFQMRALSDTELQLRYRGTDGTVRNAVISLA